jgi:hypothetical protein
MRKRRRQAGKPPLSVGEVLAWADAFRARCRRWPDRFCGPVPGTLGETWKGIDTALFRGLRGLPAGGSLPRLLAEHRGYRHRNYLPRLTAGRIIAWADAHRGRTGEWPTRASGPVADAPGETWNGIDLALLRGKRGLPGGTTLAGLLARRRGRRHHKARPPLSAGRIVAWARAYRTLHGAWPTVRAGAVGGTGETWQALDLALRNGNRGLPGGSSLSRLLKWAGTGGGQA